MIDIGIHDAISADEYHADDMIPGQIDVTSFDDPSLSSGIAKLLIDRSPAHAWTAHPKLNPAWAREVEDKFDIGTAAHRLLLEGDDCIVEGDYKDWRTAEAKEFKEAARKLNQIPLLIPQANRVREMVERGKAQMWDFYKELDLFSGGKPEQTIFWKDDHDVRCRARIDWLHDETMVVDDYKTTTASADPRKWERTMYGMGADVQVAFYLRGLRKLTGLPAHDTDWRYVVQECYPPYALSVVTLAPSAMAIANDKVDKAIALWAECLENDFWPAYPTKVASIEVPTWEEMRWLDRQEDE
jgi:hypothetical protein